jgi:hypothetical protein
MDVFALKALKRAMNGPEALRQVRRASRDRHRKSGNAEFYQVLC